MQTRIEGQQRGYVETNDKLGSFKRTDSRVLMVDNGSDKPTQLIVDIAEWKRFLKAELAAIG